MAQVDLCTLQRVLVHDNTVYDTLFPSSYILLLGGCTLLTALHILWAVLQVVLLADQNMAESTKVIFTHKLQRLHVQDWKRVNFAKIWPSYMGICRGHKDAKFESKMADTGSC